MKLSALIRPSHIAMAGVLALVWLALTSMHAAAAAQTLTWIRKADAITLDPHVTRNAPTRALLAQVYEPLVLRANDGRLLPGLAQSWRKTNAGSAWEFALRFGATFHDGTALTARDVVFSINRARSAASDFASLLATIDTVAADGDFKVVLTTSRPDPLLESKLSNIAIVSRAWFERRGLMTVEQPVVGAATLDAANGSGPYRIESREAGRRTVLTRFDGWWGWRGNISPIARIDVETEADGARRLERLKAVELGFLQDPPLDQIQTLRTSTAWQVDSVPERRSIFLGINVRDDLRPSEDTPDTNPLTVDGVRSAIDLAIGRLELRAVALNGQALPTGVLTLPGMVGYDRESDVVAGIDRDRAMAALSEAGFANGFRLTLDCARDTIANADALCRKLADDLTEIGIRTEPILMSSQRLALKIRAGASALYVGDWTYLAFDSGDMIANVIRGGGRWNGAGFDAEDVNTAINALKLAATTTIRRELILEIWSQVAEEKVYLPLVIPTETYVTSPELTIKVDPTGAPRISEAAVAFRTARERAGTRGGIE